MISRSYESLEFPAENLQVLLVNILSIFKTYMYMYNSTPAYPFHKLCIYIFLSLRVGHGEIRVYNESLLDRRANIENYSLSENCVVVFSPSQCWCTRFRELKLKKKNKIWMKKR